MKTDGKKLAKGVLRGVSVLLLILLICAVILAVMIFVWAKKVIGNAPDIHVLSCGKAGDGGSQPGGGFL